MQREVTETVFSSEVHSVKRNPSKSILDYDSPKSNRGRFVNYDSVLNSNNVDHNTSGSKSITTDLDYVLPKNCIDSLVNIKKKCFSFTNSIIKLKMIIIIIFSELSSVVESQNARRSFCCKFTG